MGTASLVVIGNSGMDHDPGLATSLDKKKPNPLLKGQVRQARSSG